MTVAMEVRKRRIRAHLQQRVIRMAEDEEAEEVEVKEEEKEEEEERRKF